MTRRTTSFDCLRLSLLAALAGPALAACGGEASSTDSTGGPSTVTGGSAGTSTGGGTSSGGTSSGGASSGGTTSSGGGTGEVPTCTNPVEMNGVVRCDEGYRHRPQAVECPTEVPRDQAIPPSGTGADQCTSDADCVDEMNFPGALRYCVAGDPGFGGSNYCASGCKTDADCGDGAICECGDFIGRCVQASCTSNADCPGDLRCASYTTDAGCPSDAYACQSLEDECTSDADCEGFAACSLDGGVRRCVPGSCAVGRPFLVDGEERLAGVEVRRDWSAGGVCPSLEGLTSELRTRLSEEWLRAARMEHASIAAFARFSMQLLAVGAPVELVEQTNQAMVDETLHARLCFALASEYAGKRLGPAALSIDGALAASSLEEIVETTILEGCIGETVAALEAQEAFAQASDPVVRTVLEQIAADEGRHAELAWQFVRWALEAHPELEGLVRDVFTRELDVPRVSLRASDRELLAHGVLDAPTRGLVRARALREVVGPCAEVLLSGGDSVRDVEPAALSV